jgi:hypothetical protein
MDKELEQLAEAAFAKYEKCQVFSVSIPERYGFIGGYMQAYMDLGNSSEVDDDFDMDGRC